MQIDFTSPQVLSQIKLIGYPTMLILMIIEGPIVTILASFTTKLGFFNLYIVFLLSVFGDVLGDLILYAVGYFGGEKALLKAEKILKIKSSIIEKLKKLFTKHGKKTVFAVKSTTGLCWITFILAGTVKMKFKDFLFSSILGGIIWSGFLVFIGYFFGYAFQEISDYIKSAGIIIFIIFAIFYSSLTIYKKYQSKKILEEDNLE